MTSSFVQFLEEQYRMSLAQVSCIIVSAPWYTLCTWGGTKTVRFRKLLLRTSNQYNLRNRITISEYSLCFTLNISVANVSILDVYLWFMEMELPSSGRFLSDDSLSWKISHEHHFFYDSINVCATIKHLNKGVVINLLVPNTPFL